MAADVRSNCRAVLIDEDKFCVCEFDYFDYVETFIIKSAFTTQKNFTAISNLFRINRFGIAVKTESQILTARMVNGEKRKYRQIYKILREDESSRSNENAETTVFSRSCRRTKLSSSFI